MAPPISSEIIQTQIVPNCGALVLAMAFSAIFYGITILQTFTYYDRYSRDSIWMKLFVAALWSAFIMDLFHSTLVTYDSDRISDTAQMISVIDTVWFYVISNYGNPASLAIYVSQKSSLQYLSAFSFRASGNNIETSRKLVIPSIIVTLSLAQWVFGPYRRRTKRQLYRNLRHVTGAWAATSGLACSMAGDFLITMAMCYNLHRNRSGVKRTDKLINVLMVYTRYAQLYCQMCSPLHFGYYCLSASSANVGVLDLLENPTAKADALTICIRYVNSALATLNARDKLRNLPHTLTVGTIATQVELNHVRVTKSTTVTRDVHESVPSEIDVVHDHDIRGDSKMRDDVSEVV
ncbi:hypothetical protein CERSUDRAFT_78316 [Gelatoporia subvermispora B]|uniref:DUF6534 domain-containing protein n=1 Tax=Ceriporiopsis subvermispora (strain B) TaxID=914234 RepID=M2P7C7_CERS8|nr:hypothetical protein CERSUDRAFT_78316 [Gelatoporia subvermispora B]